jgi:glycosyltransferase involved in cell wall biosynthesis
LNNLKTAIVHDWFFSYAGSERVVESFTNLWPDADIFTLFSFLNPEEQKVILKNKRPYTSFIQNFPRARKSYRNYLPLFPYAIEQFDLTKYDLIISSSHAVAKGVITSPDQLHICYCHTPIRYAWDLTFQYLTESGFNKGLKGTITKSILHYIRNWDAVSANRVDYFIANSNYIARRIEKTYRRNAVVIYPPVDTSVFECVIQKDDYFLTASRFVPYKKIDLIVETFSQLPEKKLLVIGDGPDENKIKKKAGSNIEFLGYKKPDEMKLIMQKAKAFVFAAEEDFGIVPLEALSCGTPVIAFNKGGTAETITDSVTGIHFNEQSIGSITQAVERLEKTYMNFSPVKLNECAKQFDRSVFETRIRDFVAEKSGEFFGKIKN